MTTTDIDAIVAAVIADPEKYLRKARRRAIAEELIEAAVCAADWLCEAHEGTDQRERGDRLRLALNNFRR